MKIRHGFLLGLGIVIPLWLRQLRFERRLLRGVRARDAALRSELEDVSRSWSQWAKSLVREVKRAHTHG